MSAATYSFLYLAGRMATELAAGFKELVIRLPDPVGDIEGLLEQKSASDTTPSGSRSGERPPQP